MAAPFIYKWELTVSINPHTPEKVKELLADYEACLKRIRSCLAPAKENHCKADIENNSAALYATAPALSNTKPGLFRSLILFLD